MYEKTEIEVAAEFLCVQLHPEHLRADYVRDISVDYHAEEIVYVLQALSNGMTSLFIGLITAYLYDKTKKPDQKLANIEKLLKEQEKTIQKLEGLLIRETDQEFHETASQHLELQKRTLVQIQDSDPEIAAILEDVLYQLKQRGKAALSDEVNAHLS